MDAVFGLGGRRGGRHKIIEWVSSIVGCYIKNAIDSMAAVFSRSSCLSSVVLFSHLPQTALAHTPVLGRLGA